MKNLYTPAERLTLPKDERYRWLSKPNTPERTAEIELNKELDFVKENYKEIITNMVKGKTSAAEELADFFRGWK